MESAAKYMAETPREEQEQVSLIRTFAGKLVNPFNMRPDDFDIRDIAHHLANLCRYTGAVPKLYSVAQHSVLVARYFLDPELRLAGLLHDASEAYINDLSSPLKKSLPFKFYCELDNELVARAYLAFGIKPELLAQTKPYDDLVFRREVASFWPQLGKIPAKDQFIKPLSPSAAERLFLKTFAELFPVWDEGIDHGRGMELGART